MDEMAALAQVSKQTVYKQFAEKERLFSEIVTTTVEEVAEPIHHDVLELDRYADAGVRAFLAAYARTLSERHAGSSRVAGGGSGSARG